MADIEPFKLLKEIANLAHINTRKENHGEEIKKGYDFKLVFSLHNSYLNRLAPGLQAMFYRSHETADMLNPENMPVLRYPKLALQKYDLEVPRLVMTIHDPDKEDNNFKLGGGKLNNFQFECKQGGSVLLSCRAQFSNPDENEVAKARHVEFEDCTVSLECAELEPEKDNFDKALEADKAPQSEAGKALADLFTGGAPTVGGGEADGLPTLEASAPPADDAVEPEPAAAAEKAADKPAAPRPRRGTGKPVQAPE